MFEEGFQEIVYSIDWKVECTKKSHTLGKWEESLGAKNCNLNPKLILALSVSREI